MLYLNRQKYLAIFNLHINFCKSNDIKFCNDYSYIIELYDEL